LTYVRVSIVLAKVQSTSLTRELGDGVLTLCPNRPDRRNAIDAELRDVLTEAVDEGLRDRYLQTALLT